MSDQEWKPENSHRSDRENDQNPQSSGDGAQESERRLTRSEWQREEAEKREKKEEEKREREREQRRKQHEHKNWKRIALWCGVGLAVLLVIFLAGYLPLRHRQKRNEAEARQRDQEQPQVDVVQVRRATDHGELTVPGTTASMTEAFIYARANGYVSRRLVDIGDHVKKGQLLAVIDAPDLDQQVDQARQQLRQAEAQEEQQRAQLNLNLVTWERWRVLVAKGVFSRQDGDQREADYKAQAAAVASAERNIESYRANLRRVVALQGYERVTAPFDGIVTQRNADVGALVGAGGSASTAPQNTPSSPAGGSANAANSNTSGMTGTVNQAATPQTGEAQGGPIFAIAEDRKLRILVSVPEGYAQSVHQGMQARVFVQERANQPINGTVTRVANALDPNTRTMLAEVDVDNRSGSLYPGMYSVVTFVQVHGVPPLVIPGDAVVVRNDRTSVALVRDNQVQIVPVLIGRDYGSAVEITGGLQEGDWVVATVSDSVQPGVKVRSKPSKIDAEGVTEQNGAQSAQAPDSGPDQYGDQSITNSQSESTNQSSKPGAQKSGQSSQQKQTKQGSQQKKDSSK